MKTLGSQRLLTKSRSIASQFGLETDRKKCRLCKMKRIMVYIACQFVLDNEGLKRTKESDDIMN